MKRLVLVFAALGLVGCFLPFVGDLTWWDLRKLDEGWTVYLVIAAFLVPLVVSLEGRERSFAGAAVATGAFGFLIYKFGTSVIDLVFHGAIGAILMGVATIGGFAASVSTITAIARTKR